MSQREAVLFAHEAYYQAFSARDYAAMEALWSAAAPVSCIHPGWHPVAGRKEVMDTWKAILSNPETPVIDCVNVQVHMHGSVAIVTCHERIMGQFLSATNVLVQEGGRWLFVHHQAGPVANPPKVADDGGESGGSAVN